MGKHKTVKSFGDAITDFVSDIAPKAIRKDVRKIVYAAYQGVLTRSPVKDGIFRANWAILTNNIADYFDMDKTKADMFDMPKYRLGDLITLSNALPYANRLEGGSSKQAPQGVVSPTKRAIQAKIENGALG